MNIILYAIPVFFILIALELIVDRVRGTQYYRVNDAISSLSIGVLSRMTGIFKNLVPFTLYILAYDNFAVLDLPHGPWMWVAAFVLYDLLYYWNHRCGHEISVFWASHVVHHSSEDYNLSTALRQSSSGFLSFLFYLPMALLGFEPLVLLTVGALNLVYQFWVHTRHVPKLGWLEWIFVTPSNHRVHHAQNQCYLDRNYGGVFIIWDRLFGSFQEELAEQPPIYGVRKALRSWNPLWANIQVYQQLLQDSTRTRRWSDKWRVWFGRTGWRPADVSQAYPLARVDLAKFQPFDTSMSIATKCYCLVAYLLNAVVAVYLMIHAASMPLWLQLSVATFVIASSVTLAWVMEGKQWARMVEWAKHIFVIACMLLLSLPAWLTISLIALTVLAGVLLIYASRNGEQPQADNRLNKSPVI